MSNDFGASGAASVLRQLSPSSQKKRRLGDVASEPVMAAISPEQQSERELAVLRQKFSEELRQLREQAWRSGIVDVEKENAEELHRIQEDLQKKWQSQERQLQAEFGREKERLSSLVQEIRTSQSKFEQQAKGVACELAFVMLTRLLGERATQGLLIKEIAEQAMAQHKLTAPFSIRVSRRDYERLRVALVDQSDLERFQADEQAAPGTCVIELEYGKVDASLDLQLAELKNKLLGSLRHDLPARL